MTKFRRIATTILLPIAALVALEAHADTTYEFDSISGFVLGKTPSPPTGVLADFPSITGVLRNTSTPTTIALRTNTDYAIPSLCVPMLLTMMEKPGQYYLSVKVETPVGTPPVGTLFNCGLVLRN